MVYSEPTPRTFEPKWLSPEDVKTWLRLNNEDASDHALILAVSEQTEAYAERCRPEWIVTDPESPDVGKYVPDAETYQGARMYAAREYRRRNSPAGIETFGDVTSFVSRYDPDIDRALQTGSYARPVIA
jgi:hypothetical protein